MLTEELKKAKIIAIIRDVAQDKILPLVGALYDGGIRFVEVTFPYGEDEAKTGDTIKRIADNFKGKLHVGAGTVLNGKQVRLAKEVGCEFVVSPNTCEEVIVSTKRLDMLSIPGAFTPTEVITAVQLGADFVKLFPASTLGVQYVSAILAPLPDVKLLAFGGVDEDNIKEYFRVGVSGVGLGASLIDKTMIANGDFDGITVLAKKYVELVK